MARMLTRRLDLMQWWRQCKNEPNIIRGISSTSYPGFVQRCNSFGKLLLPERLKEGKMLPYEKKKMKEFIEQAWKEMVMLENDQIAQARLSQGFKTSRSSSILAVTKKSENKKGPNESIQNTTTAQNTTIQDRTAYNTYDLQDQVKKRIADRHKQCERLKKETEALEEKRKKEEQEWEKTRELMQSIEKKSFDSIFIL